MKRINTNRTEPHVIGGNPRGPQYPAVADPADTDIYIETNLEKLPDRELLMRLWEADPAGDREWFRRHGSDEIRTRPITAAEREVIGLPANTMVRVADSDLGPVRVYRA